MSSVDCSNGIEASVLTTSEFRTEKNHHKVTVVSASPTDAYYKLTEEIGLKENLKIMNSISEALYRKKDRLPMRNFQKTGRPLGKLGN